MKGCEVREMILAEGLRLWQVADKLGVSPQTLSVRLRHEWTAEQVEEIRQAVAQIKEDSQEV